jgi:WD40 repeat protein
MTHIHITCAAADLPLAEAIAADFRQRKAQVSVSQPSTKKFAAETGKVIAGCDTLLLLFNPRAVQSTWVQGEIAWALQAEKPIVPLMTESTSRVDFFFLIGLTEVNLERQAFGTTLKTLASLLHLETQTQTPPKIPPAPLANPPAEPSLETLFDEKDVEGLFFAAAELVNNFPERAVFLYRFVLRLASNYAGGSARTFIEQETARLRPDLLLILSQETDDAIKKQDWQRVQNLVQDIKTIANDSPMVDRIKARIAAARLEDFYAEASAALAAEKWDEIEPIIAKVDASGIDEEIVAEFRNKTRNDQLERMVDLAYKAIQRKWWDMAQEYAERIQAIAPDNPHSQTIADRIKKGRIASYVLDANLAIETGDWKRAEAMRDEIFNLDPNSDEARSIERRIKMWRASALVIKAQQFISENNLSALQTTIAELQSLDPMNGGLKSLQEHATKLQERAAKYAECDAIYQQAIQAQAAGRGGAVLTFLRHIRDNCPDYGDPQGLMGYEITPDSAALVREVNTIVMFRDTSSGVAFSPDGSLLATTNDNGTGTLWDMDTGKVDFTITNYINRAYAFSPDGRILASVGSGNYISLWGENGTLLGYLTGKPETVIHGISFSPGGSALAAAFSDGKIRLFSVEEHKQIATLIGHLHVAHCVAFSPDGIMIASGGDDKVLCLYEAPDLRKSKSETLAWLPRLMPAEEIRPTHIEYLGDPTYSLAFSPQGGLLGAGGSDGRIRLLNPTASEAYRLLGGIQAHSGVINSLAFSSDGSLLVSASADTTLKIWDVRGGKLPEQPLATLKGHTQEVTSIAFSADNRFIASSSADHSVRLWGLRKLFDDKPKR